MIDLPASWPLIGFGIGIAGFMAYVAIAAVRSEGKRRKALEADRKRDAAPDADLRSQHL